MSKPMTWLLAGAALILTAGGAVAQTDQAARREAAEDTAAVKSEARTERSDRREMRAYRHGDDRVAFRGDRPDYLSDILQLRPDQEPALKAFLEATRSDGDHRDHMVKFDRDAERGTLQRLDEMQARMAEQQAEASRRIAAIKTFYGQLDARQQKAFDALPMIMMVGPSMGPMVIPHRIAFSDEMPMPPEPPAPPKPPAPPRL
jgi:hypothetical protein